MGVSLAGKICTRASAEPMHELKIQWSQRMYSRLLVEVENLLSIRFT